MARQFTHAQYCTLPVLLICIAPSSLSSAATDSHTHLFQSPNMKATTPPFTESGRYPFYPLLMISSSEQSIPCLCSLYTNCKVWCVGAHPSMHVCTYSIIVVCDTVCSYHNYFNQMWVMSEVQVSSLLIGGELCGFAAFVRNSMTTHVTARHVS